MVDPPILGREVFLSVISRECSAVAAVAAIVHPHPHDDGARYQIRRSSTDNKLNLVKLFMLWPWEIDSLNVSGPELTESLSLSRVDTMLHNTTMSSYESIEHQINRHQQSVTMLPHGWLVVVVVVVVVVAR